MEELLERRNMTGRKYLTEFLQKDESLREAFFVWSADDANMYLRFVPMVSPGRCKSMLLRLMGNSKNIFKVQRW